MALGPRPRRLEKNAAGNNHAPVNFTISLSFDANTDVLYRRTVQG